MESARGVQSIRLFGRADERRGRWLNLLVDQFNAELWVARLAASQQAAQNLLFGFERIVLVWLAAYAVLDNRFSMGMLLAFVAYKEQFCQRMVGLIDKAVDLRMLRVHAERVADIMLAQPEQRERGTAAAELGLEPSIELRNVSFRYADGEPWVLRELSLHIPAGQCVALTGASGCGKTTLIKLMLGLLEPTEGEVLVGGVPLRRCDLSSFRRMVGTVMQDDQLFAGSIADNISFFSPDPDAERIQGSAVAAAIHHEIQAMPMGYDTQVGDIGSALSGGQRQRILTARALYRQPRILIMDEATSHLDARNELLVNAAIREFSVTRILVAHRTETIGLAQRVVVLERGTVLKDFEQQSSASGAAEARRA
jgi:ATP-binding cassette subfamily B protein RaxB